MYLGVCAVVVLFISTTTFGAKFPEGWIRCPKYGNNTECLKKSVEYAIKDLKDGNKVLSILPLDPLHFEVMSVQQGGASAVAINMTLHDLDIIGVSRLTVTNVVADWDNIYVAIDFKVNGPLLIDGDYTVSGKVLVLPMQGQGKTNVTYDDLVGHINISGTEMMKGSKKYFDVRAGSFFVETNKCTIWLTNLFNGVSNLGDNMNKFLNENCQEIMEELKIPISNVIGKAIQQIAKTLFRKLSLESIYTT